MKPSTHSRARWLALLLLLGTTACGNTAAPNGVVLSEPATYSSANVTPRTDFVAYQDAEYPFDLYLPRDWYMGQLDLDTYGIVIASTNDPAQPRAAITILVEPVSLVDGIEPTIDGAEATLRQQAGVGDFDVELARPVAVNTMEGQERLYSYTLDDQKVRQRSFYLSDGEQAYVVSLVAPQDIYAKHDTLFGDVIASFQGDPATANVH